MYLLRQTRYFYDPTNIIDNSNCIGMANIDSHLAFDVSSTQYYNQMMRKGLQISQLGCTDVRLARLLVLLFKAKEYKLRSKAEVTPLFL